MRRFLFLIVAACCVLFFTSCEEISFSDVPELGNVYYNERWIIGGDNETAKREGMQFYEDVKNGKPATLYFVELGCSTGNVTSKIVFDGEKMIAAYSISNGPDTPADGYGEYAHWEVSGNILILSNPIKTRNMDDRKQYTL